MNNDNYIERSVSAELIKSLEKFPVVCITGPRQCGKTTLAKWIQNNHNKPSIYLDLEKIGDQRRLEAPDLFFTDHRDKLIVLDEIQRMPEIMMELRAEIDQDRRPGRFIILGSASPDIIMASSETLAGRIKYISLSSLLLSELPQIHSIRDLFFWGGFPLVVQDSDEEFRIDWLDNFIYTYLERDLPLMGFKASTIQMRRLWAMLAGQTSNLLNSSAIARSLGVSNHTVNGYLDFLEAAFLVYRVQPYHINIRKRLVKSPKIYLTDTGILHRLLGFRTFEQLRSSSLLGQNWETFVMQQIIPLLKKKYNIWFYRTQTGTEVDLVCGAGLNPTMSIEIKWSSSPTLTRSFTTSIADLGTKDNFIIIPEGDPYRLKENITVCGIREFLNNLP